MSRRGVTIREVAERAGVSTATVSRAINEEKTVAPETRERVREAMKTLGYTVNYLARSLKTNHTKTIGIMAPDLSGDFFMFIAESLDRELSAHGYSLVVSVSHESPEEEAKRLRHLAERLVDAIVMIPATDRGRHFAFLADFGIPIVFVDRRVTDLKADAVLSDNEDGAYQATKALISDGHRRIGYVGGKAEISTSIERFSGYRRALIEAGIPLEEEYIRFGPPILPFGYHAMEEMMKMPDSPDAWFLVNAFTHIGATNYLVGDPSEKARRVVIAAFDEMPYSPLLRFCRYSVQQSMAEMGKTAAKLVLSRLADPAAEEKTIRLKTRLIRHEDRRPIH